MKHLLWTLLAGLALAAGCVEVEENADDPTPAEDNPPDHAAADGDEDGDDDATVTCTGDVDQTSDDSATGDVTCTRTD